MPAQTGIGGKRQQPTLIKTKLFGEGIDVALKTINDEMEKKQRREESELMDLLIAKEWKSMFNIPDVRIA